MISSPAYRRVLVMSMLALAFVAGAFAGIAGDRLLAPRLRIRAAMQDMSDVFDRLALTPEQRVQAESIVADAAPRSRAVMLELADRLRIVADSVDAELRAILTPEQRLRLDSLRRESRLMLKRKMVTPAGTRVDTLIDTSGRSGSR
jgi:Spy/CpxP family protein refolding chaperone